MTSLLSSFLIFDHNLILQRKVYLQDLQVKVKKGNGIIVKTHKGYLNILSLQLEGKKEMPSRQFILGHKIEEGDILGKYLT